MTEEFTLCLQQSAELLSLTLTSGQTRLLARYYQLLAEANKHMNLTADASAGVIAAKHVADSLMLGQYLPAGGRVADVGSGAGFPGLILAVCRPDLTFYLIDARQKRCGFLQDTADELSLNNVQVLCARAEDLGRDKKLRESFVFTVARALSPLNVLSEYLLPLVALGGLAVAMKGPNAAAELAAAKRGIELCGGSYEKTAAYTLPGGEERTLLFLRKVKACPAQYPRRVGIPEKRPL